MARLKREQVYFPEAPAGPIALAFALGFGAINLFGAKKTSAIQRVLTIVLLAIPGWLIGTGIGAVDPGAFEGMFDLGASPFFATVGLVIVSYMGLTHVASVSEEVTNPDRNLAPAASMARAVAGPGGEVVVTVAAILAFTSVGNAGVLSEGTGTGLTPMSQGVVLPHLHLDSISRPRMVLARVRGGIEIDTGEPDVAPAEDELIQAAFFLASPAADHNRHLRILAQIAGRVDDESFLTEWLEAEDNLELREVMLRDERMLVVEVLPEGASSKLAGMTIAEMRLPHSTLAAMIRRRGQLVVPHDDTVIERGDRLTILGSPRDIIDLRHRYDVHATTAPRWWRGRRQARAS